MKNLITSACEFTETIFFLERLKVSNTISIANTWLQATVNWIQSSIQSIQNFCYSNKIPRIDCATLKFDSNKLLSCYIFNSILWPQIFAFHIVKYPWSIEWRICSYNKRIDLAPGNSITHSPSLPLYLQKIMQNIIE